MTNKETPIIPISQSYYNSSTNIIQDWEFDFKQKLDHEAIVSFCFFGFMLDDEQPFNDFTFGEVLISAGSYWVGYQDVGISFNSNLSSNLNF